MSARTCMSSSPQVMKSLDIPSNLEDPIHDVPSTFFYNFTVSNWGTMWVTGEQPLCCKENSYVYVQI